MVKTHFHPIKVKMIFQKFLFVYDELLQGNSEKCTGAFKFRCRIIFLSIYLSKSCRKSGLISLSIYRIHNQKIFILCFNFIKDINICKYILIKYLWIIFISIILNVLNDPCFEEKLSSLTLKYRPVHFSE